MKIIKSIRYKIAISLLILATTLLGLQSLPLYAQFGSDNYGQCVYGESCPVPESPDTTPPDTANPQQPTADPSENPQNDNNDDTEDPNDTPDQQDINSPNQTGQPPSDTNRPTQAASDPSATGTVQTKSISGILINQTERLIAKIPTSYRKFAPLYPWLLLLILSLVLLVLALLDRYRSNRLTDSMKQLQDTIEEQKNFIRLALHHLNTPLATIKSTLELLGSAKPKETSATETLSPLVLQLDSAISKITSQISKEPEIDQSLQKGSGVTLLKAVGQWYYTIPLAASILFTVLVNSTDNYDKTGNLASNSMMQIAVAIIIGLIFANAIRVRKMSRRHIQIISKIRSLSEQIKLQRQLVIDSLNQSLEKIVNDIKPSLGLIKSKKLSKLMTSGVESLENLSKKITMATTSSISVPMSCDMNQLIKDIVDSHSKDINDKSMTIKSNQLDANQKINVSELTLILNSVIGNAVKYSKPNGQINITSSTEANQLSIVIKDDGPGINKKDLERLFKPFSRTSDVLNYDHDGMGLSLYASKITAKRLGGDLAISSSSKGTVADITVIIYG